MGYVEYNKLKYDRNLYVGSGFFDVDMDCEYTRKTESLVKCYKPHDCIGNSSVCIKHINRGDHAVRITVLFRGEGYKSSYVCLPCIEQWLEESHQVPETEK